MAASYVALPRALARAALAAGAHTREVELDLEEVLRANLARRA